jgi:cell division protein FtsB
MDRRLRDENSRDGRSGEPAPAARRRLVLTFVLLFFALAMVLDGIAGERGWIANRRDRQLLERTAQELAAKQRENADLKDLSDRLRAQDPATMEDLARRELGLIRPGEKVFTIKDAPKAAK